MQWTYAHITALRPRSPKPAVINYPLYICMMKDRVINSGTDQNEIWKKKY